MGQIDGRKESETLQIHMDLDERVVLDFVNPEKVREIVLVMTKAIAKAAKNNNNSAIKYCIISLQLLIRLSVNRVRDGHYRSLISLFLDYHSQNIRCILGAVLYIETIPVWPRMGSL